MKFKGYDALGLLHKDYNVKKLISNAPIGSALGTLIDTTFGDRLDNLKTALASGKFIALRLHLLNNTAVRNKRLYPTEMLNGYTLEKLNQEAKIKGSNLYKLIDKQLARVTQLKYTGNLFVSGLLEHNLDGMSGRFIYDYINSKGFQAIDNPMKKTYPDVGRTELHGERNSNVFAVSHDGVDCFDSNYYGDSKYQSAASGLELYWTFEMNGNFSGGKTFVKPRDRKYFPDDYKYQLINETMKAAEPKPRVTGYKAMSGNQIFKISAEDYKNGDKRAGLPVFITKEEVSVFEILNQEQEVIGKFKFDPDYGDYEGGRYRYYLGTKGNTDTHFTLLKKNKGREWVLLRAGASKYLVNIVRRTGLMR